MNGIKAILLDTGDFILCAFEGDKIDFRKKTLTIVDPIKIVMQDIVKDGMVLEGMILKSWFPCTNKSDQIIQTSKIVSYSDVTDAVWIEQYHLFLGSKRAKKQKMSDISFEEENSEDENEDDMVAVSKSLKDFLNHMEEEYGSRDDKKRNLC